MAFRQGVSSDFEYCRRRYMGGSKGVDPDIWPQKLEIDYVRVYQ